MSVIIPTLNEEGAIRTTLEQFDVPSPGSGRRLAGRWEIIVADSGSTDGTREVVAGYPGVRLVDAPRGRGAGMNGGAAAARGDILLFLHADTLLPPNAYALITGALADEATSATGFHLRLDRSEPVYRLVWLASRIRLPVQRTFFGDQAIAVRRRDFERVGGYREQTLMEDVDLSRRLRRIGKLHVLPAEVVTSARRFERHGVIRTLVFMTGLQLAYACHVPADRLARWYAPVR